MVYCLLPWYGGVGAQGPNGNFRKSNERHRRALRSQKSCLGIDFFVFLSELALPWILPHRPNDLQVRTSHVTCDERRMSLKHDVQITRVSAFTSGIKYDKLWLCLCGARVVLTGLSITPHLVLILPGAREIVANFHNRWLPRGALDIESRREYAN